VDNAAAVDDLQSVTDTPPPELTGPLAAKPPVCAGMFVAPPVDGLPAIGAVPVVVTNPAVPAVP
jgi:hypothetical protein